MTVVVSLDTGQRIRLDRNLTTATVAAKVNDGRSGIGLIAFQNDETPIRSVYIDPAHVVSINDDGYLY